MSSLGSRHIADSSTPADAGDQTEARVGAFGENEVGNDLGKYLTREDLEKPLSEAKQSEAQLRRIFDTIFNNRGYAAAERYWSPN
jgi:hypothetical protein